MVGRPSPSEAPSVVDVLQVLTAWIVLSVPLALVTGRVLALRTY